MLSRRSVVIHEDDVGVHFTLTSERRPIAGDHSQPHCVRLALTETQIAFESILKCAIVIIVYGSRWHGQRDLGAKGFDCLVDSADCDCIRCYRFDG